MTDPINLTQLRAEIQARVDRQALWDNDNPFIDLPVAEVLALIAVAEAARDESLWYAIARLIESPLPNDHPAPIAVKRLRNALAHITTS